MAVCPHCGFEAEEGASACPLCGTRLAASTGPDGAGPVAATAAAEGQGRAAGAEGSEPAAGPPPWEDPGFAFPHNLIATWRQSVLEPGSFFPRVPWEAALPRPVLYLLVVTVIAAFFNLWWSALGVAAPLALGIPGQNVGMGRGAEALIEFFVSPFAALFSLLIGTLILHFFALFLAPERRGLGATARAICYSAGPAVFSIIPILGPPVGFVWAVVLQVLGIREAHRTTTGRAAAIVLLPIGILLAIGFALLLLAFLLVGVTLIGR